MASLAFQVVHDACDASWRLSLYASFVAGLPGLLMARYADKCFEFQPDSIDENHLALQTSSLTGFSL